MSSLNRTLAESLGALLKGVQEPKPEIIAAVRSDSPDRISYGNWAIGLHYRELPGGRNPVQRGDASIRANGFRRVTDWELCNAGCSYASWRCFVESTR